MEPLVIDFKNYTVRHYEFEGDILKKHPLDVAAEIIQQNHNAKKIEIMNFSQAGFGAPLLSPFSSLNIPVPMMINQISIQKKKIELFYHTDFNYEDNQRSPPAFPKFILSAPLKLIVLEISNERVIVKISNKEEELLILNFKSHETGKLNAFIANNVMKNFWEKLTKAYWPKVWCVIHSH